MFAWKSRAYSLARLTLSAITWHCPEGRASCVTVASKSWTSETQRWSLFLTWSTFVVSNQHLSRFAGGSHRAERFLAASKPRSISCPTTLLGPSKMSQGLVNFFTKSIIRQGNRPGPNTDPGVTPLLKPSDPKSQMSVCQEKLRQLRNCFTHCPADLVTKGLQFMIS